MEKNREGVLLSGGGRRKETQTELSENEEIFAKIVDYFMDGLEDLCKQNNIDETDLRNALLKATVITLRDFIKQKRELDKNLTVYDILKVMYKKKDEGLKVYEDMFIPLTKMREVVEEEKERLETIQMQDVFGGLGRVRDITDTVEIPGKKNTEELIN